MHSQVARLLKDATAACHARVEARLRLTEPDLGHDDLAAVLQRFVGFWAPSERSVDEWARCDRGAAALLDWPRRRRLPHLHADLDLLGVEAVGLPEATSGLADTTTAHVLGWLYVSEGSTLGGAVIDRTLRSRHAEHPRLRTFTPYDEGPGPMWRAYLAALAEWVGVDDARRDAVVRAATFSFSALDTWLQAPAAAVRAEAAA